MIVRNSGLERVKFPHRPKGPHPRIFQTSMAERTVNYYLMKIIRISGWLLLPLIALYIVTGLTVAGGYGFNRLINVNLANEIHKLFKWPLVTVFVMHASLTSYFAFRRWGWIKNRKRKQLARRAKDSRQAMVELPDDKR